MPHMASIIKYIDLFPLHLWFTLFSLLISTIFFLIIFFSHNLSCVGYHLLTICLFFLFNSPCSLILIVNSSSPRSFALKSTTNYRNIRPNDTEHNTLLCHTTVVW